MMLAPGVVAGIFPDAAISSWAMHYMAGILAMGQMRIWVRPKPASLLACLRKIILLASSRPSARKTPKTTSQEAGR